MLNRFGFGFDWAHSSVGGIPPTKTRIVPQLFGGTQGQRRGSIYRQASPPRVKPTPEGAIKPRGLNETPGLQMAWVRPRYDQAAVDAAGKAIRRRTIPDVAANVEVGGAY